MQFPFSRFPILRKIVASAGILGLGTALAQAITMMAAPILSRLFGPEQIGLFGTFLGLTVLFTATPCLNLQQAILLERDELAVAKIVCICVAATGLTTSVFIVGLVIVYVWLPKLLQPEVLEVLVLFGPLSVVISGVYWINHFLNLRRGNVRALAHYQVSRSVVSTIAQLLFFPLGTFGLALGQTLGQGIGILRLAAQNGAVLRESIKELVHFEDLLGIALKFKRFALFGAPQSFLNAIAAGIPTVLIASLFDGTQAGLFWLAYRVFGLPNQIIAESLRSSFYQNMAVSYRSTGDVWDELVHGTIMCGLICAPFALLLLFGGPSLFVLVFGTAWRGAGVFAQYMAIAWLVQLTSVPATVALTILQLQGPYLAMEAVAMIFRLGAFGLAQHFYKNDAATAVGFYSFATFAYSATLVIFGLCAAKWRARSSPDWIA